MLTAHSAGHALRKKIGGGNDFRSAEFAAVLHNESGVLRWCARPVHMSRKTTPTRKIDGAFVCSFSDCRKRAAGNDAPITVLKVKNTQIRGAVDIGSDGGWRIGGSGLWRMGHRAGGKCAAKMGGHILLSPLAPSTACIRCRGKLSSNQLPLEIALTTGCSRRSCITWQ